MSEIVLEAVTTWNILPSFENNLTVCQYGQKRKVGGQNYLNVYLAMPAKFSFIYMTLVKSNIFPAFCVFCGIYIECFIGCERIYIN